MGEYTPTIDDKGRVAIPVKLRRAFGEDNLVNSLVAAPGFDRCIMAFRKTDWQDFVNNKLAPLSQADPKNRMRSRFLLGGAAVCDLDSQGRILIPANLKEYAGIDKDVAILGVCDRIEIWNMAAYNKYKPDGAALESFAAELGF